MRTRTEKSFITTISSVSHEGKGIAYKDDKVIFIDNALLNEEVEYKIIKKKKDLAFAKSLNIIKPSIQRIEAKCDLPDPDGPNIFTVLFIHLGHSSISSNASWLLGET